MVRLTAELILTSPSFVNPLKQRELDLRGNKIAQIENLGASEDQYDVLDFSDNDITRLEGFPLLKRLSTILLNNNRVQTIEEGLGSKIPNLEALILTNNRLENLADLDALVELKKLHSLCLMKNPVTRQKHYRLYIIHKIPTLRTLDFQKVRLKERQEATVLFGGEAGEKLKAEIIKTKTFVPGATHAAGLTTEQKQKISDMLKKAETMEEVQRLERILASGKVPKELRAQIGLPPEEPATGENGRAEGGAEESEIPEIDYEDLADGEIAVTTTTTMETETETGTVNSSTTGPPDAESTGEAQEMEVS